MTVLDPSAVALDRAVSVRLRPRYSGANIRTWLGFKTFMALAEEAVLTWFRESGTGPQALYHRYGLGLSVVDSSVQLPAVLEVDDEVEAWVQPRPARGSAPPDFAVRLTVDRDGRAVPVLRGTLRVALVREPGALDVPAPPEALLPWVTDEARAGGPIPPDSGPPPGAAVTGWDWRARYFHCQYSDRVQHGSYVAALEEVVDRFLADRDLSVPRLLSERGWIPVVSRARVRLHGDAHMDEVVHTTFTVPGMVKDVAFDGRMECRAGSAGRLVATAEILHGYAVSRGPDAGSLARLDVATIAALTGGAA